MLFLNRSKMTAILGGGISGLSAAYYCLENPKLGSIALYEASNRLGGWIKSKETPSGHIFEKGPRTIRPGGLAGKNTLELIDKLNLTNKIISIDRNHPAARNRLIYVDKQLHVLPNSLTSLFKVNKPFDRRLISIILNDLKAPKSPKEDESIYSFVERRLGKDVADYLISPMICGICAGDAKKISVNFLMKPIFKLEQKYGSITKGVLLNQLKQFFDKTFKTSKNQDLGKIKDCQLTERSQKEQWSVWSLTGGLEQLPIMLESHISSKPNIHLEKEALCDQITFKQDTVELSINGKVTEHRRIISSLSAKSLAPLLKKQHPKLSKELEDIPFVTVAVINLHFPGNVLPMKAFGFLVPPQENLPILGMIFDSCIVQYSENTVLTVMMGGAWFDKYFGNSPTQDEILSIAVNHAKSILNIKQDPVEHDVSILKDCIPQYVVGHNQRLQRIDNYISAHKIPMALCGSSYKGVGLNDVILSAKEAVSHIAS
ncbi:protoporphyrinogen oxidase [Copidosoma floridanum]|uniref:protoporphyrinogen oxidase n=1 Tax=Copidosoma floridanum TaxID=29053 RepID=UPI0006C97334|nr:protoporphyrinogen oxidase [Copidosoma floridanum]